MVRRRAPRLGSRQQRVSRGMSRLFARPHTPAKNSWRRARDSIDTTQSATVAFSGQPSSKGASTPPCDGFDGPVRRLEVPRAGNRRPVPRRWPRAPRALSRRWKRCRGSCGARLSPPACARTHRAFERSPGTILVDQTAREGEGRRNRLAVRAHCKGKIPHRTTGQPLSAAAPESARASLRLPHHGVGRHGHAVMTRHRQLEPAAEPVAVIAATNGSACPQPAQRRAHALNGSARTRLLSTSRTPLCPHRR